MSVLESSAIKICKSSYVMVYGFQSCKYQDVIDGLMDSSHFIHIFDYNLGYKGHDQATEVMPPISQINVSKSGTADACKAALVNIVGENYKRSKAGRALIPVLFALDCENNSIPLKAENVATKKEEHNKKITYKELRRVYKLCEEFHDPEIRAIARETFKFLKVYDDLSLELIPAPWRDKNWKEHWTERMQAPKKTARKKPSWRKELSAIKDNHNLTMSKSVRSSSSSSSSSSRALTLICPTKSVSSLSLSSPSSLSFFSSTHSLTSPASTSSLASPPSLTSPPSSSSLTDLHLQHYKRRTYSERATHLEKLFMKAL